MTEVGEPKIVMNLLKRVKKKGEIGMEKEKLNEILKAHSIWLKTRHTDDVNGEQADLRWADLRGVEMSGVDLSFANMKGVNMRGAKMIGVNMSEADMSEADMSGAKMIQVDMRGANLIGTKMRGVDAIGVDMRGANMRGAVCPMCCPEKGEFTGFKKVPGDYIVELRITESAKRSSAITRKCRCSEAVVVNITDLYGKEVEEKTVFSTYDPGFSYTVGETVSVDNFDENRWNECAPGIHFFITRKEAVDYIF